MQALRLGLLAGQALEQSDNPAKTYPQTATPKGWSFKISRIYELACFERPKLRAWDYSCNLRQRWGEAYNVYPYSHYTYRKVYRIYTKNIYIEKSEAGGTCRLSTKIKAQ